jgi:phosphoribosyl 1,2-cyclic phosphate phosphodiesterase
MLLRFLGTSAGELYPGLWCRCRNCEAARRGSPKDRRQSAALSILPDKPASTAAGSSSVGILIDFPSEIGSQADRHCVDLTAMAHLLVTHSHGDHWFPYLLRWRAKPGEICEVGAVVPRTIGGPRFTELPLLHIWGNSAVEAVLHRELGENLSPFEVEFHRIQSGDNFTAGVLTVTSLRANHDVGREEAVHYVLQDSGKTILYGLDGDTFLPQTREALRSFRFDLVILESTYGHGDGGNHRNFTRVLEEAAWMRRENLMAANGRIVATHFSPHHCPPHEETAGYLGQHNIEAAWDGMEVNL